MTAEGRFEILGVQKWREVFEATAPLGIDTPLQLQQLANNEPIDRPCGRRRSAHGSSGKRRTDVRASYFEDAILTRRPGSAPITEFYTIVLSDDAV
jgi:hypothetical protein